MKNPYAILGVAIGTSKDDCKKAWRTLSRKYHPDNGGDEHMFDEVQKAWRAIESGEFDIVIKQKRVLRHKTLFSFA